MIGNMPQRANDKGFVIDGWQFYYGVWGDEMFTTAKLVVEAVKGRGIVDGDPKVAGPTWKSLTEKMIDEAEGNKLTEAGRAEFLNQFIIDANASLAAWVKANGSGELPVIPKDFWGWLRWQFLFRVQFDSSKNQLVI